MRVDNRAGVSDRVAAKIANAVYDAETPIGHADSVIFSEPPPWARSEIDNGQVHIRGLWTDGQGDGFENQLIVTRDQWKAAHDPSIILNRITREMSINTLPEKPEGL